MCHKQSYFLVVNNVFVFFNFRTSIYLCIETIISIRSISMDKYNSDKGKVFFYQKWLSCLKIILVDGISSTSNILCAVLFGSFLYLQVDVKDDSSSRQGTGEIRPGYKDLGELAHQRSVQVRREKVVNCDNTNIRTMYFEFAASLFKFLLMSYVVCVTLLLLINYS